MKNAILVGILFLSSQTFAANFIKCNLFNNDQNISLNIQIDLDDNSILTEDGQKISLYAYSNNSLMARHTLKFIEQRNSTDSVSNRVSLNFLKTHLRKGLPLLMTSAEYEKHAAISLDPNTKVMVYSSLKPSYFVSIGICR